MELSRKIASLKPSPTVALNGAAKELRQKGIDVFNFAVGEPDFPTPKIITEKAIESLREGRTKYGPPGGGALIKDSIIQKLAQENGLSYQPDQIVVGIGAKELLFHLFLSLINDGDEVIVFAPYWVSYTDQILAAGGRPVVVPMAQDQESPRITPAMIEAHVSEKTKAVVINSPNNPGGYVLSRTELEILGQYFQDKPYWVISDEIYEYMSFDEEHHSLGNLEPELMDRYIHVNGLSKGAAMTGWRVGYLAAPTPVAKLVKTLQSQSSTCLPPFIEDAAVVALKEGKKLLAPQLKTLIERRDLAVKALESIEGVRFIKPQGAFYIFIDIRQILNGQADTPLESSLAFSRTLLEKYHIAMVPGEAFGVAGFLRLSYATDGKTLEAGLTQFKQAINELRAVHH